uniref:terminase small subunit-like protein n=1 Tax=uncultured Phenylobacterium sp. TaxID=349273 RepID=UPI0025D99514
ARAGQRVERLRGRYRAFDPVVAERLYVRLFKGGASLRDVLASDPAFPSMAVLARWRREAPRFDAMLRFVFDGWRTKPRRPGRGKWSPELEAAVLAGIVEGGSLRSLAARPDMPCARTLYAWCRTRPGFAAAVAQACVDREDWYRDQLLEIAMGVERGGVGAARRAMAPLNAQLVRLKKRPGWKSGAARG